MKFSVPSCNWLSRSPLLLLTGVLLVGLVGSGCGSAGAAREDSSVSSPEYEDATSVEQQDESEPQREEVRETRDEPVKVLRLSEVRAELESAAEAWYGTPYKWGGSSQQGVDCSGFVKNVFEDAFSFSLPRVTETQLQVGAKVGRDEIQPGDLVFFRPENEYNHVGVYIGDGTFVHASSSNGVTDAPLDKNYWRKYYWTSRRPLTPSKLPESLRDDLVAYKYPDSSSTPAQASDSSSAETVDASLGERQLASCNDPEIDCGSSEATTTSADREQRKGW